MKRTTPIILSLLAAAAGAFAQSPEIEKALSPLAATQAQLRDGATVVKWKADFTYDTEKKGTNKMVCYDLSGWPTHPAYYAECTDLANLPRVAQNLKIEAMYATDRNARDKAFKELEDNGTRVKPEFGSVWIHRMGADAEHLRSHVTVAVPGATGQSMGLPENGREGGVWIMNAGTTTAHLMIPGN